MWQSRNRLLVSMGWTSIIRMAARTILLQPKLYGFRPLYIIMALCNENCMLCEQHTPFSRQYPVTMKKKREQQYVHPSNTHSSLVANKSIPWWDARAWLWADLSSSPRHAQSMVLVLNLTTSLVSPQFYVILQNQSFVTISMQHIAGYEFDARFSKSGT